MLSVQLNQPIWFSGLSLIYRITLAGLVYSIPIGGGEFVNRAIDRTLETNHIRRSLFKGGTPLDNAVIESTNHIIKTECLNDYKFQSLDELNLIFGDYVHWYNHVRLHSHLGYKTPMQLRHSEDIKET